MGIAGAALCASLLSACSGSISVGNARALDSTKLEKAIRKEVEAKLPIRIGTVSCPNEVKIAEGDVFACLVEIDNQQLEIEVTQTDDDGNVDFEAVEAVLDVGQATDFVEDYATKQAGRATSANCGESRVLILEPGRTFMCNVTDGTNTGTATVTVKDVDGNVSVKLNN